MHRLRVDLTETSTIVAFGNIGERAGSFVNITDIEEDFDKFFVTGISMSSLAVSVCSVSRDIAPMLEMYQTSKHAQIASDRNHKKGEKSATS
jgi:hypothetical protein